MRSSSFSHSFELSLSVDGFSCSVLVDSRFSLSLLSTLPSSLLPSRAFIALARISNSNNSIRVLPDLSLLAISLTTLLVPSWELCCCVEESLVRFRTLNPIFLVLVIFSFRSCLRFLSIFPEAITVSRSSPLESEEPAGLDFVPLRISSERPPLLNCTTPVKLPSTCLAACFFFNFPFLFSLSFLAMSMLGEVSLVALSRNSFRSWSSFSFSPFILTFDPSSTSSSTLSSSASFSLSSSSSVAEESSISCPASIALILFFDIPSNCSRQSSLSSVRSISLSTDVSIARILAPLITLKT